MRYASQLISRHTLVCVFWVLGLSVSYTLRIRFFLPNLWNSDQIAEIQ